MDGHVSTRRPSFAIERLARWWSQAAQAERFSLLRRTLAAEKETPSLSDLQLAIYLSEAEAGQVEKG